LAKHSISSKLAGRKQKEEKAQKKKRTKQREITAQAWRLVTTITTWVGGGVKGGGEGTEQRVA